MPTIRFQNLLTGQSCIIDEETLRGLVIQRLPEPYKTRATTHNVADTAGYYLFQTQPNTPFGRRLQEAAAAHSAPENLLVLSSLIVAFGDHAAHAARADGGYTATYDPTGTTTGQFCQTPEADNTVPIAFAVAIGLYLLTR